MKIMVGFTSTGAAAYAGAQGWQSGGVAGNGFPLLATPAGEEVMCLAGIGVSDAAEIAGNQVSEVIYGQNPVDPFVAAAVATPAPPTAPGPTLTQASIVAGSVQKASATVAKVKKT